MLEVKSREDLSDSVSIYSVMKLQLPTGKILEYVTQRTLLVIYPIIKLSRLEDKPGQDNKGDFCLIGLL